MFVIDVETRRGCPSGAKFITIYHDLQTGYPSRAEYILRINKPWNIPKQIMNVEYVETNCGHKIDLKNTSANNLRRRRNLFVECVDTRGDLPRRGNPINNNSNHKIQRGIHL